MRQFDKTCYNCDWKQQTACAQQTEWEMFSQALEDGETAAGSSWTTAQLPEARAFPHRTLLACITLTHT